MQFVIVTGLMNNNSNYIYFFINSKINVIIVTCDMAQ